MAVWLAEVGMADDGGPGQRLKGQKKRTNPRDIAKREAEKCKYGLDFFGVGTKKSNDLCVMLCHLIWDCA